MTTGCTHSHDHSASPDISPSEAAKQSAREAGLRYVSDKRPGISRKALEKGFEFLTPSGDTITDEEVLQRIRKLAIPPAWTEVWIAVPTVKSTTSVPVTLTITSTRSWAKNLPPRIFAPGLPQF